MQKIIDCHVHFFPEQVAAKAIANMEKGAGRKMATDGTWANLTKSMELAGITHVVNLPVSTRPEQVPSINRYALSLNNPRVIPFGSIHPQYPLFCEEIQRLTQAGIKGIKMHPDYQNFWVDDPMVFPIYEALAENNLILALHMGNNVNIPPPARGTPERLAKVVKKFPSLKIIAAHLGGWQLWNDVERHLAGLPLWLDLSFTLGHCPLPQLQSIIRQHGTARILYGTDSPWESQTESVKKWMDAPFSTEEKKAFFYENAATLLSI